MRAVLVAAVLTCSTWPGIRTCSDAHGHVSYETQWQGMTNGWDNQGDRWTTSRWRGIDITTISPPDR